MYGNNGPGNRFNGNQQSYWRRGQFFNNPRSDRSDLNYSLQSCYAQRDGEQCRRDYKSYQNPTAVYEQNCTAMLPPHNGIPSLHHNSFHQKENHTIYNTQTGDYKVNTTQQNVNQGYNSISNFQSGNYEMSPAINQPHVISHNNQGQLFQRSNDVETTMSRGHAHFQPSNVSLYPNQVSASQPVSQEDNDKIWLKQWLEQRQLQTTSVKKTKKTLKISEAQNLFQHYLSLNNQLKEDHDELQQNVDSAPQKWDYFLAKAQRTKEDIKSIENVLNDPDVIKTLQEKIHKRKQKRLWLKRRRRRRYLEKEEDEERRKLLHQKIDVWQKEIREKDLAARKAASLKHEAGGVLGEVRRKLQDCRKLQELIKSLVKLRELRKSEGEKKGVYPKTSLSEDNSFETRCAYVEKMLEERSKTYDEEEKALRVIIMEEEGEREKKEKQERLEQKAMLNLSKEADPLAEYSRYYGQADESIQYLIQIRREWDMYLTPDVTLGSRIPNEDITAGSPTSSLWASVLKTGE